MTRFAPGQQLDRYRIEELLGAGAYAETYKATDTTTGDTVVLKCPDPNLFADPSTFNRYQREAVVAKRLDHPGVQRAVDAGNTRTEPYLVLDYIDGRVVAHPPPARPSRSRSPRPSSGAGSWPTRWPTSTSSGSSTATSSRKTSWSPPTTAWSSPTSAPPASRAPAA